MTAQDIVKELETTMPLNFGKYYFNVGFKVIIEPSIMIVIANTPKQGINDLDLWNSKYHFKITVRGFNRDGSLETGKLSTEMFMGDKKPTKWSNKNNQEPEALVKFLKTQFERMGKLFHEAEKGEEAESAYINGLEETGVSQEVKAQYEIKASDEEASEFFNAIADANTKCLWAMSSLHAASKMAENFEGLPEETKHLSEVHKELEKIREKLQKVMDAISE